MKTRIPNETPKTAVIYARYSSHAQKDVSIDIQIEYCRRYADDHGITILGVYPDKALSGTTDKRPEFKRMIRDASRIHFDVVLVYKMDRFARNRYDSASYKARLKKFGTRVCSVTEPIPEGPEGILLESILEGNAEYYSANLAFVVKNGMLENAESAMVNGLLPFGYQKSAEGKYEINEHQAAVVREIYKRYTAGERPADLIADLNRRGIKTARKKEFTHNSLFTILKNRNYIGEYDWGGIHLDHAVPAILTEEEFMKAQQLKAQRSRQPAARRADYLLTGKLFCGLCGSPMTGECGTGRSGTVHTYYTCTGRKRKRSCAKTPCRRQELEDAVIRVIIDHCLTDEIFDKLAENTVRLQQKELESDSECSRLRDELADLSKRRDNVMAAIEQGVVTPTTAQRLRDLEAEYSHTESLLLQAEASHPTITAESIRSWLRQFRSRRTTDDPAYRRLLVDVFVEAVYVYDDHIRIVSTYNQSTTDLSYTDVDSLDPTIDPTLDVSSSGVRPSSCVVHHKRKGTPLGVPFLFRIFEKTGIEGAVVNDRPVANGLAVCRAATTDDR